MLLINSLQTNYWSRSYLFSYESTTSGFYVDSFWQIFYFLLLFLNFSASKVQWRSASKGWQLVKISVAWNCVSCSTWGRKKAGGLHSLFGVHPEIDRNIPYWSGGSCNNHHKVSHAHFCTSKTLNESPGDNADIRQGGRQECKHMPCMLPFSISMLMADNNNGSHIYFSLWKIFSTVFQVGIANCWYPW